MYIEFDLDLVVACRSHEAWNYFSGQSLRKKIIFSLLFRGLEVAFPTSLEDEKLLSKARKSKGIWSKLQHIVLNIIRFSDFLLFLENFYFVFKTSFYNFHKNTTLQ